MAEITRDFTSCVYIIYKNKVLLHKHKKYGLILPVGGHLEKDELPHEAAIRESKEEAGLDVKLYNSNNIDENYFEDERELNRGEHLNLHNVNQYHQHAEFVFYAKSNTDQFRPNDGESKELSWHSREDIENSKDIRKAQKTYALEALELLKE